MRNDTAVTDNPGGGAHAGGFRTRFDRLRVVRRRSPLGLPEALALGVAALLLLTTVLAYLFLLVPQNSRRQSLEDERDGLQKLLQTQRTNLGETKDTQQRAGEILASLERFEIDHLGLAGSGTKNVIEEMNRLIIKNNLRISGGVSYTQLQEAAPGSDQSQTQRRAGSNESAARVVQSVFPGIGVTLTVEGTYPNLRHFMRDIEADNQFVVINTVELEGVTDSAAALQSSMSAKATAPLPPAAPVEPPAPQTPSRGALVSLRLDMAAYFRRSGVASQ